MRLEVTTNNPAAATTLSIPNKTLLIFPKKKIKVKFRQQISRICFSVDCGGIKHTPQIALLLQISRANSCELDCAVHILLSFYRIECCLFSKIHSRRSSYFIFPDATPSPTRTTSSTEGRIFIPFVPRNVNSTYIPILLLPSTNA